MNRFLYLLGLFFCLAMSNLLHADCYRHIYNASNKPWTFEFIRFDGDEIKFSYHCALGKPCVIESGHEVEIRYGNTSKGTVRITDANGHNRDFYYRIFRGCGYVDHDGATGSVSLNDPTNGDFRIGQKGDQW